MEDRSDASKLHLICDVKSQVSGCPPQIHLVSGHSSCTSLPNTVNSKKLADIDSDGEGDVVVDAEYSELPGKCIIVLQPNTCPG